MRVATTIPTDIGKGVFGFTCILNGGRAVIPGFRLYMGKIQAPMRRVKQSWFPMLYLDRETACQLYNHLKLSVPGAVSTNVEKAISDLVHDSVILERFGLA